MSASSGYGTGGSGPVGPTIDTITGNVGGPVGPTANNVNLIGAGGVVVTGNPGTSTLTITVSGIATQYDEDIGTAVPAAGILRIVGGASTAGINMTTIGAGNTVDIILDDSLFFPNTNGSGTEGVLFWGGNRFLHNFGTGNVFLGSNAGNLTLTPSPGGNIGIGMAALIALTTGDSNTCIGNGAGEQITAGHDNTVIGAQSMIYLTTGNTNTTLGTNTGQDSAALTGVITGSFNILLGGGVFGTIDPAGANYTSNESSNIMIRNPGVIGESHIMRLGEDGSGNGQQNATFIAGIYNRAFGSPSGVVQIDSTFKVGSSAGTNGQLLIGATGASPLWANLTSVGGSVVITNGANTINLEATGTGAGASAFPTDIGTANEALGVLNILGGAGTAGTNIRTNGSGNTVTVILKDSILMPNTNLSGSEGVISWGGNRFIHNRGADNTFVGQNAGNLTLTTGSATDNACFGAVSGTALTTGAQNALFGSATGTRITTGSNNIALGFGSLDFLTTGGTNIGIGNFAGLNYTTSESDNILLSHNGVMGESNTIRIGTQGSGVGQQDTAFMAGIFGSTVGATNSQVFIDNTGKLGTVGGGGGAGNQAFLVVQGVSSPPQTPGTDYVLGTGQAMTTIFDNGGNVFVGDGVGGAATFTAPITGQYFLNYTVVVSVGTSGFTTFTMRILTTSRTFFYDNRTTAVTGANHSNGFSVCADMTAGDTAEFSIEAQYTGSNPYTVLGEQAGSPPIDFTWISGFIIT